MSDWVSERVCMSLCWTRNTVWDKRPTKFEKEGTNMFGTIAHLQYTQCYCMHPLEVAPKVDHSPLLFVSSSTFLIDQVKIVFFFFFSNAMHTTRFVNTTVQSEFTRYGNVAFLDDRLYFLKGSNCSNRCGEKRKKPSFHWHFIGIWQNRFVFLLFSFRTLDQLIQSIVDKIQSKRNESIESRALHSKVCWNDDLNEVERPFPNLLKRWIGERWSAHSRDGGSEREREIWFVSIQSISARLPNDNE